MKRLFSAVLLLSLLLCGCNAKTAAPTAPAGTSQGTSATTSTPETEPMETLPETEPAPTETTEPPVVYRHPITGVILEEPFTTRPVAVATNNAKAAMPQHGISQADVIYEMLAEGGTTRHLAVYTDLTNISAIGSIRSARTYLQSVSRVYDAVLVHCGGSTYADSKFRTGNYPHADAIFENYFYRDQTRRSSGYALEHTLFVKGTTLFERLSQEHDMVSQREDYGFRFAEDVVLEGQEATQVTVHFIVGSKTTQFTYESEQGAYSVYQHKRDYIDGNTGNKVYFTNVLILHAERRAVGSGHVFHTLEGENTGFYLCQGKLLPIRWSRPTEEDPFTYTYEDGSPVIMTPGTTYVAIMPPEGQMDVE